MSRPPNLYPKPKPSLEEQVADLQQLVSSLMFNPKPQPKPIPSTPCNFTQHYQNLLNSLDPKINSVNQSLQSQIANSSNMLNNMFTKFQQDTNSKLNALNTNTTSELNRLQSQYDNKLTNQGVQFLNKVQADDDNFNKRLNDVYARIKNLDTQNQQLQAQFQQTQAIDQQQATAIAQLQEANTIFDDRITKLENQFKMIITDYTCKIRNLEARLDQAGVPMLY
jgi:chromosome segregation ATPase